LKDYEIIYESSGAGPQVWDCRASTEEDAIEQFSDFCMRYTGNCNARNSIISVDWIEDLV
jgi:hypothetical protein